MRKSGGSHLLFHQHLGCLVAEHDKESMTARLSEGVTLLILTEPIRLSFFFWAAQCHRIDVVSGCGKNAEGAVQTLSLEFHNVSQKL